MRGDRTLNGKEGRLYMNGTEMAHVKTFKADVEKKKGEVPIMGKRFMSYKTAGVSGKGTMTLYKINSEMVKTLESYIRTGVDAYFTFQGVLDDPGAQAGTERVTMYDVNLDSTTIAQLDVEKESLEEEVPFTFEDFQLDESLKID